MESNTIYLSFIQVEAMEVEQVGNELQQVFRRSFHVVEIEALPSVNGEPGEQVSISHNGTQGSLEIVGNGKHQLFAGGKQLFGKTIGFFQLTPITVTTGDIPPVHILSKDCRYEHSVHDQDVAKFAYDAASHYW